MTLNAGVITLEDVLEEVIQDEIVDESDRYMTNDHTQAVRQRCYWSPEHHLQAPDDLRTIGNKHQQCENLCIHARSSVSMPGTCDTRSAELQPAASGLPLCKRLCVHYPELGCLEPACFTASYAFRSCNHFVLQVVRRPGRDRPDVSAFLALFEHKIRDQSRLSLPEVQAIAAYLSTSVPEFSVFSHADAVLKVCARPLLRLVTGLRMKQQLPCTHVRAPRRLQSSKQWQGDGHAAWLAAQCPWRRGEPRPCEGRG